MSRAYYQFPLLVGFNKPGLAIATMIVPDHLLIDPILL